MSKRRTYMLFVFILLLGVPVKLFTAQNLVWEMDIIPVVARTTNFIGGDPFPVVGTLSSVAGYNMPGLIWLNAPAIIVLGDPWLAMVFTQLAFNLVGTAYAFVLGATTFNRRAGLAGAAVFTLMENSISGSYTAWAQLIMPTFGLMVVTHLLLWIKREHGGHLAAGGVAAVYGFMTHFAAVVMFPAMLLMPLVSRARWQLRGLLIGAGISALLLAPYMIFQVERDFVDLRAFATRDAMVPDELAVYEYLKPGAEDDPRFAAAHGEEAVAALEDAPEEEAEEPPPRIVRLMEYAVNFPRYVFDGLFMFNTLFPFTHPFDGEEPFRTAGYLVLYGARLVLALGLAWSIVRSIQLVRRHRSRFMVARRTIAGRSMTVGMLCLGTVIMLVLMLALPERQPTYYYVLQGICWVLVVGYIDTALAAVLPRRAQLVVLTAICALVMGLHSLDAVLRVTENDPDTFAGANAWRYRQIEAAADYIASDWGSTEDITISYDVMPLNRTYWWVPAWNSVDPLYRLGVPYDVLLEYEHGIHNTNMDPIGTVEDADYLVTYTDLLENHDVDMADVETFGVIAVVKLR